MLYVLINYIIYLCYIQQAFMIIFKRNFLDLCNRPQVINILDCLNMIHMTIKKLCLQLTFLSINKQTLSNNNSR